MLKTLLKTVTKNKRQYPLIRCKFNFEENIQKYKCENYFYSTLKNKICLI